MAYINAEQVKAIRQKLKEKFPQFKFSVRLEHYSSVSVSIMAGPLTFEQELGGRDHIELNHYYLSNYDNMSLFQSIVDVIKTAPASVNGGQAWYDKSDAMIDYFDTAYYFRLSIGQWDKPYIKR